MTWTTCNIPWIAPSSTPQRTQEDFQADQRNPDLAAVARQSHAREQARLADQARIAAESFRGSAHDRVGTWIRLSDGRTFLIGSGGLTDLTLHGNAIFNRGSQPTLTVVAFCHMDQPS